MSSSQSLCRTVFHVVGLVSTLYHLTLKASTGCYFDAVLLFAKACFHGAYLWRQRRVLVVLGGHITRRLLHILKQRFPVLNRTVLGKECNEKQDRSED